jgi:hypothetical protein
MAMGFPVTMVPTPVLLADARPMLLHEASFAFGLHRIAARR